MKPVIVTGAYGTGKTEFCLQSALNLRKTTDEKIVIADLDVMNPYFRSREREDFLRAYNIEIAGSSLDNNTGQDIPALSFAFKSAVRLGLPVIIDLAGSENGLKVLSSCRDVLTDYEMLCVCNVFRRDMDSADKIIHFVRSAEAVSGIKVTGLVNNSHLLRETTPENIIFSLKQVGKASETLNIPVKLTLIKSDIYSCMKDEISSPVLTFDKLVMREDWQ